MKTKQIITSVDPEGLLIKCNVSYILMFFQNKLLVNQKRKLVADMMMDGWVCACVCVCVCVHVCTQLISHVQFFVTSWTAAHQALCSWFLFLFFFFSRQEYRSGLPFPPPGNLPDPGIEPVSPALVGRFFITEPPGKPC